MVNSSFSPEPFTAHAYAVVKSSFTSVDFQSFGRYVHIEPEQAAVLDHKPLLHGLDNISSDKFSGQVDGFKLEMINILVHEGEYPEIKLISRVDVFQTGYLIIKDVRIFFNANHRILCQVLKA